jgi:CubicO group peptidase (beta-lactamase class C family)
MQILNSFKIRSVAILIVFTIVLSGCGYFWRALIYQKVGILDYDLFPNRVIEHGTPQPYLESLKTVGFLVIKDNKLLYEYYPANWSDTTISNSFSMAKSIVSMLIGICIDKGFIDSENDLVSKYIPEYNNQWNRDLTIRNLLDMASGLNWDEAYANPWSTTTKAYYGRALEEQVLKLKVVEPSGKKHDYKSGDTQLLSLIVRNASKMSVSEFIEKFLWSKIGAETNALWSLDRKNGVEKAYCCVNSNVRDFARLGQLILNKGKWNSEQILSETYIKKMLTPAEYLIDEFGKPTTYYGYQFWKLAFNNIDVHYMRGINGQYIFVIPEKNTVIVRLGHQRSKERIDNIPADIFKWIEFGLDVVEKVGV